MAPRTLALTGFCDWPEGLPPAPGLEAPRARIAGYMRIPVRLAPAPQPECRYAFRHSISLAAPASTAAAAPVAEMAVAQSPSAPASPPPLQGELRADGAVPTGAPAIAAPGAAMAATAAVAAAATATTATTATATEAAPAQPQAAEKPAVSTKKVIDPSVEPAIPVLELQDITKSFGENRANDGISLSLRPGEKHALLGENGAGKSTLVRIAYGMLQPDGGRVLIDGVGRRVESPAEARRHGIGMVFQHFSTFDALTVAENLAVALPDRGLGDLRRGLREIGKTYGLQLDPHRRVGTLSAGEKQRLEIVRCLLQNPRVLILDEPTSVLAPQETDALFATLNRLSEEGVAILYISHRLEDVRRLCETATILRGGKVVAHCDPRETSAAALGEMMIGAATARPARRAAYVGAARLEVTGLDVPARDGGMALKDITFSARKGELLGIAGVAGEGQSELFAALSGEAPTRQHDAILFDGQPVGRFGPSRRRHFGAAFAPEQRLGHAAIPELRLSENLRLTLPRATVETARKIRETFSVAASGRDPFAGALSGGNLQKFVIGREISRQPGILIAEQPTWGVDVGSAAAIHEALMELRERKAAIVIISQDLDEIFALCDRVAVLHRGRLSEPRLVAEVTAEEIGLLMGGADPGQAEAAEAGALLSESGSALHA